MSELDKKALKDEKQQNDKMPNIGVIIAAYNAAEFLPQAIASAVMQDYPEKEIIIVDDGSTDNTKEMMEELLGKKYEHNCKLESFVKGEISGEISNVPVKYIHQINQGPSSARNTAIKSCYERCELFAILDSDDYWLQGKLSKSAAKIFEAPEVIGAVYTDNYSQNIKTGNVTREFRESFDHQRLLQHNMIHSGCIISRMAFEAIGGLYDNDIRGPEDLDLWFRITEKMIIYHIPEPLVIIRFGDHNISIHDPRDQWQRNLQKVYDKLKARNS